MVRRAPKYTSCAICLQIPSDDTCVAILENTKADGARLHFSQKVTADNSAFAGIHPATAVTSHQHVLSKLISESFEYLPDLEERALHTANTLSVRWKDKIMTKVKPGFISVTRGPGMSAALSTGLDTAKGLAVAWQVPLVGVHHMQAHALTPRLVNATMPVDSNEATPEFPFMSLLVSGGHTLLVESKTLCDHSILASTIDIAIGDALDKMARSVLPMEELEGTEIMYGRILERYAFRNGNQDYNYRPPTSRAEEIAPGSTKWGWALPVPFADVKNMRFSFSGLGSAIKRICDSKNSGMSQEERTDLAREGMRVAFEHLATRVIWGLKEAQSANGGIENLVVSGGVASNGYLRHVLRSFLNARGFQNVRLLLPPIHLCTDNAAMIAWAGMEMYERGWTTDLSARALRRWSLDSEQQNGILGAPGWTRRQG